MSENIHVGDIGTAFTVTITDDDGTPRDISDADTLEIDFKAPDRSVQTQTAIFVTDGSNGQIRYITAAATDLHMPGPWRLQAHVASTAGSYDNRSEFGHFPVQKNL